jgi:hypothetical protein
MAAAARVTSGPMPSPGNNTMVFFMVVPERIQISRQPPTHQNSQSSAPLAVCQSQ